MFEGLLRVVRGILVYLDVQLAGRIEVFHVEINRPKSRWEAFPFTDLVVSIVLCGSRVLTPVRFHQKQHLARVVMLTGPQRKVQ